MRTYWDLSVKEKSELSAEELDAYVSIELMTEGLVRPLKPELAIVEEVPEPDTDLWMLKAGYSHVGVGYLSAEDAANALKGAVSVESEYYGNYSASKSKIGTGKVSFEHCRVYSSESAAANRKLIERAEAAKKANEKATEQHEKDNKAISEALERLYTDYHECCATAAKMSRVKSVFADYLKTAGGDAEVAEKFLLKAFTAPDVTAAKEWYGELSASVA